MMLRIVAIGFGDDEVGVEADGPAMVRFPARVDRPALDAVVAALQDVQADGDDAVVVYPSWAPEPTSRHLHTARAALGGSPVALYASAAPPLAGDVLVALATALADRMPSDALVAGLGRVEAQLLVLAWLSKVSGLRHPAPSLWQHALSWLPWTAFGVSSWPEPAVRRLPRGDETVPLPNAAPGSLRIAAAARGTDLRWVHDVVAPGLDVASVDELAPTALGPQWWGTRRLVEVVAYPARLDALVRRIDRVELVDCGGCARRAPAGDTCRFCRVPAPAATDHAEPAHDDAAPPEGTSAESATPEGESAEGAVQEGTSAEGESAQGAVQEGAAPEGESAQEADVTVPAGREAGR